MDDHLKKLTERALNAKHGAPRFDPGQLKYAEINNGYVTFYLRTHAVAVTFDQLTAEEAQLAQLYIRKSADQKRDDMPAYDLDAQEITDDMIDEEIADFKAHPESYKEINVKDVPPDLQEGEEKRDDDGGSEDKKGLLDAIFYVPPYYVIKYRFMFALVCICAIIGVMMVGYILNMPYNNDKNEASTIAQKDPALQEFIAGRQASVEPSSAYYYDPAIKSHVNGRSDFMDVELSVWIFNQVKRPGENFTHVEPYAIGTFHMIVDLKNDTTMKTDESVIYLPQV